MLSKRQWLWILPALFYVLFWAWYTPLSGPLSQDEIEEIIQAARSEGLEPTALEHIRTFFENDDGGSFVMVNALELNDNPPDLPATGADAAATDLLGYYMEYMYPSLLSRASHPVFAGEAAHRSLDVVGIENAEVWDSAALMRYRSRRDLWKITSHPSFRERHEYKIGALEKTIAFPVRPQLFLSDLRLIIALLLLSATALIDLFVLKSKKAIEDT